MKRVIITRTCAGQWLYTIYIDDRVVVVGMSSTRERAETFAKLV